MFNASLLILLLLAAGMATAQNPDNRIPSKAELIDTLVANVKRDEKVRELYAFERTQVQISYDRKGQGTQTGSKTYNVIPVAGVFISRLIKVNGKELSALERGFEESRFQEEVAAAKRGLKARIKQNTFNNETTTEIRFSMPHLLRITNIISITRESYKEREVLAVKFAPPTGFTPASPVEELMAKLAGLMFIDAREMQVVRVEARLTEIFKTAKLTVYPPMQFIHEYEKIRDEVWLPVYAEVQTYGKNAIIGRPLFSNISRYTGYKKFNADLDLQFEAPGDE